jgi:hypothetical protein
MVGLPIATFLAGLAVGLSVALPIGPMGVLCIQQTLAFGLAAGFAIGMAAATVQVIYGTAAVLGLGATAEALVGAVGNVLSLIGALLLFWMALNTVRRRVLLCLGPRVRKPTHSLVVLCRVPRPRHHDGHNARARARYRRVRRCRSVVRRADHIGGAPTGPSQRQGT